MLTSPPTTDTDSGPISTTVPTAIIVDVDLLILSVSQDPIRLNGQFGDLFEGTHSQVGSVALKRPRVVQSDDNEDVIRVRLPMVSADISPNLQYI